MKFPRPGTRQVDPAWPASIGLDDEVDEDKGSHWPDPTLEEDSGTEREKVACLSAMNVDLVGNQTQVGREGRRRPGGLAQDSCTSGLSTGGPHCLPETNLDM